jgi:hypothetical protein
MAVYLLAGCASYPALPLIGNQNRIRVSPLPAPGEYLQKKRIFSSRNILKIWTSLQARRRSRGRPGNASPPFFPLIGRTRLLYLSSFKNCPIQDIPI